MSQVADHSYLSTAAECLRRFHLRYNHNLRPHGESPRMTAGSAMHAGLAVLYGAPEWSPEVVDQAVEAIRATFGSTVDSFNAWLTAGHLEVCFRNYVDHYREREQYRVVKQIEEPIVIGGLGGIPDLLVEDREGFLVLDHKCSTNYLGTHLFNRVKFAKQLPLYCHLVSVAFDRPVRRAVVNAIYIGERAASKDSKAAKFERYPFEFSPEQIAEAVHWTERQKALIHWMRQTAERDEDWPQHGGSHCGWCEFAGVCEVAPPLRPGRIRMGFESRPASGLLLSGADDNE